MSILEHYTEALLEVLQTGETSKLRQYMVRQAQQAKERVKRKTVKPTTKEQITALLANLQQESYQQGLYHARLSLERVITWLDPQNPIDDWHAYTQQVRRWAQHEVEQLLSKERATSTSVLLENDVPISSEAKNKTLGQILASAAHLGDMKISPPEAACFVCGKPLAKGCRNPECPQTLEFHRRNK